MASIFHRQTLTASQLRTVAQRRFDDARALVETRKNVHANGAQYLCGFAVEMLLKSHLIRQYPSVASRRSHEPMSESEREVWSLIYRSHDLDEMLRKLPQLSASLEKRSQRDGKPYLRYLNQICESWTIYARYSPLTTSLSEARQFLERVRVLKEVLQ